MKCHRPACKSSHIDGSSYCLLHRNANREAVKRFRKAERRRERKANGQCYDCGALAVRGTVLCQAHIDKRSPGKASLWVAEDMIDRQLGDQGHCKCGLRLPCNGCIPTARDYAGMRRAA